MIRKYFGYFLIAVGIIIGLVVTYRNSRYAQHNPTFSPYSLLTSSWEKYVNLYIGKDGRVIDTSQDNITTSEGQSYAMLRSVWIDDKSTFDLVWTFTKNNMKRPSDNLFGWRWGKRNDGTYGFMDNGGDNSASDADSDIALALILAKRRWGDQKYEDAAVPIIKDMWKLETDNVKGNNYLIAGNWAKSQNEIVMNPSYLSPYAWRVFASIDKDDPWMSLVGPSYDFLNKAGTSTLDGKTGVGLPPDWVAMDRQSGELKKPTEGNLDNDYSFDAMRVPWRVYLDYEWSKDQRALDYLTKNFSTLKSFYQMEGKIPVAISHDGKLIKGDDNPAMYATALGYFLATDRKTAMDIYQNKIVKLYSNDTNTFIDGIPYYELNWLWFGTALYDNRLQPYS